MLDVESGGLRVEKRANFEGRVSGIVLGAKASVRCRRRRETIMVHNIMLGVKEKNGVLCTR
jgi:hypothetical protein